MAGEDVGVFSDALNAVFFYLLVERCARTKALCCPLAGNNITQMPNMFNQMSLSLLGINADSDLPVDARAGQFANDVNSANNLDPSMDALFYILKCQGLLIPRSDGGGNYHVIMRNSGLATLQMVDPKCSILLMGLSISGEIFYHFEGIRFVGAPAGAAPPDPPVRLGYYLLLSGANCQVAYLGNRASLARILFTETGLASLRDFLEGEYSRGGDQVRVNLGDAWAADVDADADPMPLLLVPRLNLPLGIKSPWEMHDGYKEVRRALGDTVYTRLDKTVPADRLTSTQFIDLGDAGAVNRYIADLSIE